MIKLVKSTFYNEESTKLDLISFISKAKQLSFGKECEKFERRFAKWQGRRHCVFVNSGSSANLALFQALLNLERIKILDPVGFSAVTWSTNVMPLVQLGLNPIPIDIEINTLNVSSTNLKKLLRRFPIKVLFLTNLLGFCDDIDEIAKICKREGIILLEDNCESLGTVYRGRKLGNFGLASTFSFYVGHHLSTVEGGAICTDDEDLATMLRLVRAHGWDRNLDFVNKKQLREKFKVNSTFYSRYTFYDLGFNLRPTEINGFIGNAQMKYANEIVKKRERNFLYISNKLNKLPDNYYPLKFDHIDLVSNFAYPLVCRNSKTKDKLVRKCAKKIEIRPIVAGDVTNQPFFLKYSGKKGIDTPNARLVHENGLYFGNNPELTNDEIETLIQTFS